MIQNNIQDILTANPLIPVATIHNLSEVDTFYEKLKNQGVYCIEITLRTDFAWDAIALFKEKYGREFKVGVGTIITKEDVAKCKQLKVDFMVSPGLDKSLFDAFEKSGIPYIGGAVTPSEIIAGIHLGCKFFKFFPADLFGGIQALKTYAGIFKHVVFCPTGGINPSNYQDFLALKNVQSVGGSWLLQD